MTPRPAIIRTVCKYSRKSLVTGIIFALWSYVFLLTCRSFTSRKLYVCPEKFSCFSCINWSSSCLELDHLPLSMLGSSVWSFPLFKQSLTRFRRSSRFPFNFNPLHFSHRLNCSTVYSSGSRSNLDPGTPSSSVKTVKHCCALLAIRIHFLYFSYRIGLCLSESQRGSEIRDVISAKRYSISFELLITFINFEPSLSRL